MLIVLNHIRRQALRQARLPLFDFLRDESLSPRDRLGFMPALAPYVMVHGDLMRHVLRDAGSAADPLQQQVRAHTLRAEHDWAHYLDDLMRLGTDPPMAPIALLRRQFGDAHVAGRMLGHKLAQLGWHASPAVRLVLLATIDQAQAPLFALGARLVEAHRAQTGAHLRIFNDAAVQPLPLAAPWAAIDLDEDTRADALACVDDAFCAFGSWSYELLRHALARPHMGAPAARAAAPLHIDACAQDEESMA